MARNTTLDLTAGEWTELTSADVTAITFQNVSGGALLVKGAANATAPTDDLSAVIYSPLEGERAAALADLFPGIAAKRVYGKSSSGGKVMVSHA